VKLPGPLVPGRLVRRYKRFLADVALDTGEVVTAHTSNPGRMTGLTRPGSRVWLSVHDDPRRKLPYTWEVVRVGRTLAGVNPVLVNALVADALGWGAIPELAGYPEVRREVAYGSRGSRVDLVLDGAPGRPPCYVECKSVTLVEGRVALFPDAPTERGRRHLAELEDVVAGGARAVALYVVQRADARAVAPADAVDPEYGDAFRRARSRGVEALAYQARVSAARGEVRLTGALPVLPAVGAPA